MLSTKWKSSAWKSVSVLSLATFVTIALVFNLSGDIPTRNLFRVSNLGNEAKRFFAQEAIKPEHEKTSEVFCETLYIGCYKNSAKMHKNVLKVKYHFMTPDWCISFCQSNNRNFASLNDSTSCLCSDQFDDVTDIRNASDNCGIVCGGTDLENGPQRTCGGEDSVETFFIKGDCVREPLSEEYMATRHRGCIDTPQEADNVIATSSQQCLMFCGKKGHPLSLYAQDGKCWCGKADKRFVLNPNPDSCNSSGIVDVFRTLVEDKRCGNIRLLPPGKHRTVLASYPGSGNTWTRYLLEKATGYYTGSVFNDGSLRKIGYLGEITPINENRTDIIKDHSFGNRNNYQAGILIIRNPYKSMVSFYNYMNSKKDRHITSASEEQLQNEINKSMLNHIGSWKGMNLKATSHEKPLLVVYYEDLVADPISNVRKMVEFLPNPILHPSDLEERLACLSQDTTGLARRPPRKLPPELFSKQLRTAVNKAVAEVRERLRKIGVPKELPPYEKGPEFDW